MGDSEKYSRERGIDVREKGKEKAKGGCPALIYSELGERGDKKLEIIVISGSACVCRVCLCFHQHCTLLLAGSYNGCIVAGYFLHCNPHADMR